MELQYHLRSIKKKIYLDLKQYIILIKIVRILDEHYGCFNTKKRVPYKIVLETVDLKDLNLITPNTFIQKKNLDFD